MKIENYFFKLPFSYQPRQKQSQRKPDQQAESYFFNKQAEKKPDNHRYYYCHHPSCIIACVHQKAFFLFKATRFASSL